MKQLTLLSIIAVAMLGATGCSGDPQVEYSGKVIKEMTPALHQQDVESKVDYLKNTNRDPSKTIRAARNLSRDTYTADDRKVFAAAMKEVVEKGEADEAVLAAYKEMIPVYEKGEKFASDEEVDLEVIKD